jgi:hypothetical protein
MGIGVIGLLDFDQGVTNKFYDLKNFGIYLAKVVLS